MADAVLAADPMAPVPMRLAATRAETHDTFTIELEPPGGAFGFAPGQFNMLYAFGVGESAISISGDPSQPERLVHTIRAVGGVTRALQRAAPGSVVGVRGPFGEPWPVEAAAGGDVVVAAGGIGLAPLRPVIYRLLADRESYERVVVLYGTRSPGDLLFADQVREWRGRFDMDVLVTVDSGGPDWHGAVGVVTKLIVRAAFDPEATTAFVCGPEIMMRFAARELMQQGVAAERVYLSAERNMKCAVGFCGHCQFGPNFVCKDGPVFSYAETARLLDIREV